VAGEHTSESGNNEGIKVSVKEEIESENEKPFLVLKRGCLAIFKLIMYLQLAFGIMYIVTNYVSLGDWLDFDNVRTSPGNQLPAPDDVVNVDATPDTLCFLDHPEEDDDIGDYEPSCVGVYKQCPLWGRCHSGVLQDCTDGDGAYEGMHRFVPNVDVDAYVVSHETELLIEELMEALIAMTVSQSCRSWDRITDKEHVLLPKENDEFPLFSLEKVAEKMQDSMDQKYEGNNLRTSSDLLLWLLSAFEDNSLVRNGSLPGYDEDDVDVVGLGTRLSPASLPLAFTAPRSIWFGNCWDTLAPPPWRSCYARSNTLGRSYLPIPSMQRRLLPCGNSHQSFGAGANTAQRSMSSLP